MIDQIERTELLFLRKNQREMMDYIRSLKSEIDRLTAENAQLTKNFELFVEHTKKKLITVDRLTERAERAEKRAEAFKCCAMCNAQECKGCEYEPIRRGEGEA